jgi:hypothetical protein
MKLHFFTHSFIGLLSYALMPLAVVLDRTLTFLAFAFDHLMPMTSAAVASGMIPTAPTREVTYPSDGVHRLAQNILRRGPNDDDEGGEDLGNGLTDAHPRC